jgi:hypothetical protein
MYSELVRIHTTFARRHSKTVTSSVSISAILTEIQTGCLPNTGYKRFHLRQSNQYFVLICFFQCKDIQTDSETFIVHSMLFPLYLEDHKELPGVFLVPFPFKHFHWYRVQRNLPIWNYISKRSTIKSYLTSYRCSAYKIWHRRRSVPWKNVEGSVAYYNLQCYSRSFETEYTHICVRLCVKLSLCLSTTSQRHNKWHDAKALCIFTSVQYGEWSTTILTALPTGKEPPVPKL